VGTSRTDIVRGPVNARLNRDVDLKSARPSLSLNGLDVAVRASCPKVWMLWVINDRASG